MTTATLDAPTAQATAQDAPVTLSPAIEALLPSADAPNPFRNTTCLIFNVSTFSNRRKIHRSQYEVKADKSRTNASKQRLASPELGAISKRDGQMRDWLRTRALPSPLKKSAYQLPISLIEDVENEIRAYNEEREALVETFIKTYPDRYDEAVQALDGIFNPLDYPVSSHELRAFPEKALLLRRSFSATHSYIRFDIDRNLETVDPELYRRQARQAAQEWRELIEGVSQMLKIEMSNLTTDMLEKLNGATPSGRQKVIRSTFLPNVRDFLSVVDSRNINNDQEITRLAQQMRSLVEGVDDDALKRSVNCRAAIQQGFQCISTELSKMITDRPTRAISFDDDEPDAA